MKVVLTCEHGGNNIPGDFAGLFNGKEEVLNSHRGYDPGALELFMQLKDLADYSFYSTTSRLLVELNRSPHNRQLFSEFTKPLSRDVKQRIMQDHYFFYRDKIEQLIQREISQGEKVLHISVHTFTPVLNAKVRNADVGLLFDPSKALEKDFVRIWKFNFKKIAPGLNIRFNYPYLGRDDGFTTYLRKKNPTNYLGIELEVNQAFFRTGSMDDEICGGLYKSLQQTLK
ncbi:N-formylglutamate amidohydrolase [Antarcticibacterium flavum]|uniref:N-formylglutamate amidohydrolase n=1 Tax=Antarcticibacterium flavum TaxID=2058175 RepID=A0A5B7WYB1_9FLAO|nr:MULTISPECIES: N-formylglutamate amidohydrolase [Antarcticibacterium]MCM4158951.1 N-formylglutamate amidohydrolase [Antarcticibacterium sp. W02-3]QCY68204.1 N-formylglutamate amidohydrolase [Antarcticibacterium flavum]